MHENPFAQFDAYAGLLENYASPAEREKEQEAYFDRLCKHYHIDFATADPDEKAFIMFMAQKGYDFDKEQGEAR
jgi:hypothetical protein